MAKICQKMSHTNFFPKDRKKDMTLGSTSKIKTWAWFGENSPILSIHSTLRLDSSFFKIVLSALLDENLLFIAENVQFWRRWSCGLSWWFFWVGSNIFALKPKLVPVWLESFDESIHTNFHCVLPMKIDSNKHWINLIVLMARLR